MQPQRLHLLTTTRPRQHADRGRREIEDKMMRGLRDKIAIVAGAAPGNIGGATAFRLAQEGMKVIAADLNEAAAQAVVDEIKSTGGYAVARGFDITDESAYKDLVEFTARELGGLDALFNVAADLSSRTIGRDTDVLSVPLD